MSIHQRLVFSYPTSAPTPTDSDFSSVALLLDCEGTAGLQDFTDASSYAASPASIDATVVISATAKYSALYEAGITAMANTENRNRRVQMRTDKPGTGPRSNMLTRA